MPRTKAEPGDDEHGHHLMGLKMTALAERAIGSDKTYMAKIKELRGGRTGNNGTYTVNGHKCYHTHVGGRHAIAWRKEGDYLVVEAILEHNNGNDYQIMQ